MMNFNKAQAIDSDETTAIIENPALTGTVLAAFGRSPSPTSQARVSTIMPLLILVWSFPTNLTAISPHYFNLSRTFVSVAVSMTTPLGGTAFQATSPQTIEGIFL